MCHRSAADGVAAPNTVRRTRVGIVEGVLRLSAVETEQKEGMRVFFLVTNFADSNFELADTPYFDGDAAPDARGTLPVARK